MSGYIGTQPVPQATQTRDSFTATSGQTSFATGGYTPNFLDVYLNGVKLASADYTATNGSDVVLASGAATGDILEVVAFTTFNSASSSIDDNGTGTAITIDSNNNVGIGTIPSATYSAFDTIEFETASIISQNTATAGNLVLGSNMNYSSGGGPEYKVTGKATQITQIGGDITLGVATSGTANTNITYNTGLEVLNDGYARAKNGLLFGTDTAAANALEDYEEGTWTPVPTFGGSTAGIAASVSGSYTKIGRQVNLYWTCTFTNLGSATGEVSLGGVPFTSTNISHINSGFSYIHRLTLSSLTQLASSLDGGNEIKFRIAGINTGNASNLTSTNLHYTSAIHGAISYQTNS